MSGTLQSDLFANAIAAAVKETRAVVQVVAPSTIHFLEKYVVPEELQELLKNNSYDRPFQVGNIYYYQANGLAEENLEPENIPCINEDLLIVGCGLNGDPVVIDLRNMMMGFIFHDRLWGDPSVIARNILINTGLSIGEFYTNALSKPDSFPVDAYDAEEIYGPDL